MERQKAFELLLKYNKERYHIQHALAVEEVMKWFATELGYDPAFWGNVGLLHDIDFEMYPDQHCIKAAEILRSEGCDDDLIRAVCSHGYGITVDIKPEHEMEKVLYGADELTGIVFANAKMRPSGSIADMELKSLKKKFNNKAFAAGCSRDIISKGAEMLGWDIDKLLNMTLEAMRASEQTVLTQMEGID
ncbi:MAG: HDIG domain-containing protein [Tannerella sp.]|jgi:putative nucleotidyltransferase with HDIG domain|nr:HDIG domain-containing protein [Tannerella sp.]